MLSTKRIVLPSVLALMMMSLIGCAHGPEVQQRVKEQPSSSFLITLVNEYVKGEYGNATREVVKSYISQNEPEDLKK